MDLVVWGAVVLISGIVGWGVQKPFWLTLTWTVEDFRVDLQVRFDYSGIHKYRSWHLPIKPARGSSPTPHVTWSPQMMDRACWAVTLLQRLTDHLFARMRVLQFDLSCRLGLADAAQTALWTAQLSTLVSGWIALRVAPRAQQEPRFAIEPIWDELSVRCNFTSIIQLRLSDIILAMISGLTGLSRGGIWHGKLQRQHP